MCVVIRVALFNHVCRYQGFSVLSCIILSVSRCSATCIFTGFLCCVMCILLGFVCCGMCILSGFLFCRLHSDRVHLFSHVCSARVRQLCHVGLHSVRGRLLCHVYSIILPLFCHVYTFAAYLSVGCLFSLPRKLPLVCDIIGTARNDIKSSLSNSQLNRWLLNPWRNSCRIDKVWWA